MPVKPKAEKPTASTATVAAPVDAPEAELVDLGGDVNRAAEVLPKLDASPPFLLAYHPSRWDVIEGYCLPALATISVAPGINGVEEINRGG